MPTRRAGCVRYVYLGTKLQNRPDEENPRDIQGQIPQSLQTYIFIYLYMYICMYIHIFKEKDKNGPGGRGYCLGSISRIQHRRSINERMKERPRNDGINEQLQHSSHSGRGRRFKTWTALVCCARLRPM